jgi:hypothetical protein
LRAFGARSLTCGKLKLVSQVPNRDHLVGKRVRLKLNPWASPGPTEGSFNGQGERGLSIIVEGGGRFIYSHHEVAEITALEDAD